MNNSKVSIIVPTYNVEAYLDKAVKSIMNQTYADTEVIIVDDGSTDTSGSIAERYATSYSNVKVIHKKNQGLAQARKTGVELATGQFIMFVDADDWIEAEMIERLLLLQKTNNADVVACCHFIDSGKNSKKSHYKHKGIWCINQEEAMKAIHTRRDIRQYMCIKLFKREIFQNIDFPKEHMVGEDYLILTQVILYSHTIVQTDEALYHYVQRNSSMSNRGYGLEYQRAYTSYLDRREQLLEVFPKMKKKIIGYHVFEELGIVVAMFRNDEMNLDMVNEIVRDIRGKLWMVITNHDLPIHVRGSAVGICINYRMVRFIYRKYFKFRTRNNYE